MEALEVAAAGVEVIVAPQTVIQEIAVHLTVFQLETLG